MRWRFATDAEAAPYQSQCSDVDWISPSVALFRGRILRRILALEDNALGYAGSGDIGGLVEKESNLSQYHQAWCGPCAKIMDDAIVSEQAHVREDAVISDTAKVFGNAQVMGDAEAGGSQWVYPNRTNHLGDLDNDDWLC